MVFLPSFRGSLSSSASWTSLVASWKPWEADTGTEIDWSPARTWTRIAGGSIGNNSSERPSTVTERKRVDMVWLPSVSVHCTRAAAAGARVTAGRTVSTGTTSSGNDRPPWKYSVAPPLTLKQDRFHGVAISSSPPMPKADSGARRKAGASAPPWPTHTRRLRIAVLPPGASILSPLASFSPKR